MQPSGGHTGELSPDAVLTGIDAVLWEEYTREQQPQYLRATDDFFFKQGETVGIGFIWDEDSNVGSFEATGEQEELINTDTFIGNQTTKQSQKWIKQIPISDEAFKADMVGKRAKIGEQVGDRARLTQDKEAIQRTYADAFAGSIHTTPDGQALIASALILKSILNNLRNCGKALRKVIRSQAQKWEGSETIMQTSHAIA